MCTAPCSLPLLSSSWHPAARPPRRPPPRCLGARDCEARRLWLQGRQNRQGAVPDRRAPQISLRPDQVHSASRPGTGQRSHRRRGKQGLHVLSECGTRQCRRPGKAACRYPRYPIVGYRYLSPALVSRLERDKLAIQSVSKREDNLYADRPDDMIALYLRSGDRAPRGAGAGRRPFLVRDRVA